MTSKKIIHIDMDCFYAAIEMRDNPTLVDKPIAVGGSSHQRGVICTSNYVARQYGVRSAMATSTAMKLCKDLILLPVNMPKYKAVADQVQQIFRDFTERVEPLSLDEAYLDVSGSILCQGSATLIAKAIKEKIWEKEQLTASAGVAPNKFLAKIASGWKKPNGLFVIKPSEIQEFVKTLAVKELYGVGKVTAEKLQRLHIHTCADLQKLSISTLRDHFGKFGHQLYEQCRGIDHREVMPNRERKSLSVEHTFPQDITDREVGVSSLKILYEKLQKRLHDQATGLAIKSQFIKVKFNNFRLVSVECSVSYLEFDLFSSLFADVYAKVKLPIRLLGVGVHFHSDVNRPHQYSLFADLV